MYDVFVCYADKDMDWVSDHLMPQLEGERQLRLCIHERDFIPGKNIVDNISDCVAGELILCKPTVVLKVWKSSPV